MAEIEKPDLCVIGAGVGGLSAAEAARALGASVVVVERGEMGGDRLHRGGVPAAALIASAERAHLVRNASRFGMGADEPRVNFGRVNAHIRGVIDAVAPHSSAERFTALGIEIVRDHARFIDRRTVAAGDRLIRARRFVIATGSEPRIPDIPGLSQVPYYTSETIFTVTRKPAHLLVIGGGATGLELAQAHLRLGCRVTLVERREPLADDDPELTTVVLGRLAAEGLEILSHTGIVSLTARGNGDIVVEVKTGAKERSLTVSHLLVATGSRPRLEDLGLEAGSIARGPAGLVVNKSLRTTNRRVYAIGEAAGAQGYAHVAAHQGERVVRAALLGLPAGIDRTILPWATRTDPGIAHVGLTESMARQRYQQRFAVTRWPYAQNDRAKALRRTEGVVKMLTDRRGRIIGASIVGPDAGEAIALFALAIARRLSAEQLLDFAAPYPSYAEMARSLGAAYRRSRPTPSWPARLAAFNRLLP